MLILIYYLLLLSAVLGYAISFMPKVYLFHLVFAVSLIFFVFNMFLKGGFELRIKKIRKYLVFFLLWFVWILVSFSWAADKALAEKFALIYLMMFLFTVYLIVYNRNEEIFKKTLRVLFIVFLLALLVGTLEAFTPFRLPMSPYAELDTGKGEANFANLPADEFTPDVIKELDTMPTSFFYNPNNYATFLSFALPFILFGIGYVSTKRQKIFLIFIALLTFINIVMTSSNTNVVVFLIIFMAYFWISWMKDKSVKNTSRYVALIFSFLIIAGLVVLTNKNLQQRLILVPEYIKPIIDGTYMLDPNSSASISVRGVIMHKIISPEGGIPLWRGNGVGNTMYYLQKLELPLEIVNPHNWWLELLGDFGLLFLIFYLLFFISLLRQLWKNIKSSDKFSSFVSISAFVSLLGFIVASMSPSSIAYFIPHWILISIAIIAINLAKK